MQLIPQFNDSAGYILAAYGLAFVLLGGAIVITFARRRAARQKLDRLEKSDEK